MAQITIGRILPIFKGDWDSGTTYTKLDIVYYNGSSYVAKIQNTNQLPTNTFYWQLVAKASSWSDFTDAEKEALVEAIIAEIEEDINELSIVVGTNTYNDY